MKFSLLAIAFFWTASLCFGQNEEFPRYNNSLIYSPETMQGLSKIADSLNLKFRICEVEPVFYSSEYAIGVSVYLDAEINSVTQPANLKNDVLNDIKNNISLEKFKEKYPFATVKENAIIVRSIYYNSKKEPTVYFKTFDLSGHNKSISKFDPCFITKPLVNQWVYNDEDPTRNHKIIAYYFPSEFNTVLLPPKYSKMIAYADCMIDTTHAKMSDEATQGNLYIPANWQDLPRKKQEELLEKMRSTIIYGQCSMDGSPRQHAMNIALLAAETQRWEIFLKAHLDIMNDNFPRMSDGSYAWGARKTYIKELEELNINVIDLLLGICFSFENPAAEHYFADIARIGRALSESSKREEFENVMLTIIKDEQLDLINRIRIYFLFKNYVSHLDDESEKEAGYLKLEEAIAYLPFDLKDSHKRWR